MKNPLYILNTIIIILLISSCTQKKIAQNDWVYLFNGKDLTGWKANENEVSWRVEDGLLVTNGERSHLFYMGEDANAEFKNFELSLDIKTMYLANSGVYFHTKYQENGWPSEGYEAQIDLTYFTTAIEEAGLDYRDIYIPGNNF